MSRTPTSIRSVVHPSTQCPCSLEKGCHAKNGCTRTWPVFHSEHAPECRTDLLRKQARNGSEAPAAVQPGTILTVWLGYASGAPTRLVDETAATASMLARSVRRSRVSWLCVRCRSLCPQSLQLASRQLAEHRIVGVAPSVSPIEGCPVVWSQSCTESDAARQVRIGNEHPTEGHRVG